MTVKAGICAASEVASAPEPKRNEVFFSSKFGNLKFNYGVSTGILERKLEFLWCLEFGVWSFSYGALFSRNFAESGSSDLADSVIHYIAMKQSISMRGHLRGFTLIELLVVIAI